METSRPQIVASVSVRFPGSSSVSVVTNLPWLGRSVAQGRSIYISAEDDEDELHRRLHDILTAAGKTYDDVEGLTLRSLAGEDALLARDGPVLTPSELFVEIERLAASEEPVMIALDTLADLYPANENDRAKVRQFIGLLRGLALRQDCVVLLLGHPSLAGMSSGSGSSGSTAWSNSVRSRLYLERITSKEGECEPNLRRLKVMKANYGPLGTEIDLTWRLGVFDVEGPATGLDRLAKNAKAERVFLKLLDEYTSQARFVSSSPSRTYAPGLFSKHPSSEGMTSKALESAMNALFSRGVLCIEEHGRGASTRTHIARSGPIKHA